MNEGIVEVLKGKPTSTGGTVWNAKISGTWIGCGFNKPTFKEGDRVKYDTVQNGKYTNIGDVEVLEQGAAPAVTRDEHGINAVDRRTVLHAARASAIDFVDLLARNEAVSLGAKGKKEDVILALVEQYAAKWYEEGIAVMQGQAPFVAQASDTSNEGASGEF